MPVRLVGQQSWNGQHTAQSDWKLELNSAFRRFKLRDVCCVFNTHPIRPDRAVGPPLSPTKQSNPTEDQRPTNQHGMSED